MSYSRIVSAVIQGLEVKFIQVEADLSNGLPVFHMVGYLSAEVKEAGERVRTAIRNCGMILPAKRMVINLSPANIRKRGGSFDLPIALAILVSLGEIRGDTLAETLVIGELGLNGQVRSVHGILPIVAEAKKAGYRRCIVPAENEREALLVDGVEILCADSLKQVCDFLNHDGESEWNNGKSAKFQVKALKKIRSSNRGEDVDFSDILGQEAAKRAAEIAVAGRHNFLLIGPPGSGKSMIARRIPTILPELTLEESIEITKVYSVMGMLDPENPLMTCRPFREVHHTVTKSALIGGGTYPRPGEISLASKGVLFLDELAEFQKAVLEVLRQPLEDREVRIVRNQGAYCFPADIMLVAAMNPCPCGYYPDYARCSCTSHQIQQYLGKVSQPFLSRMDICIEVPGILFDSLKAEKGETSGEIRRRIQKAREIQKKRFSGRTHYFNAGMSAEEVRKYCALGIQEEKMIQKAFDCLGLTARTYHKILKVARTIADLAGEERIALSHLQDALGYRVVDKKYWGGNE